MPVNFYAGASLLQAADDVPRSA